MAIKKYRGREIKNGVFEIYRNLHNNMFSIRQNSLVVAHGNSFVVNNIRPKISESGRQRVLREKRKNVHAVLVGDSVLDVGDVEINTNELDELYYDPYKLDRFINKRTGETVTQCDSVFFLDGKVYILN